MIRARIGTTVFASACLLWAGSGQAFAWGCIGHQAIGMMTQRLLPPATVVAVRQVLAASPIDPAIKPYCTPAVDDPIANAATWADDVRAQINPSTAPWHFIDLPIILGKHIGSYRTYCPPGNCLVDAIVTQYHVLTTTTDAKLKGDALRYILHFIGDVHQPLHTVSNGDRGGNCVPITIALVNPPEPPTEDARHNWRPNLHALWDEGLINHIMAANKLADSRAFADYLLRQAPVHAVSKHRPTTTRVARWAVESSGRARETTYGKLPVKVPMEPASTFDLPSCDANHNIGTRMAALHEIADDKYAAATTPVVVAQLRLAAERLAAALESAFE